MFRTRWYPQYLSRFATGASQAFNGILRRGWHLDFTGMKHNFMFSIDNGRISKAALSLYTFLSFARCG